MNFDLAGFAAHMAAMAVTSEHAMDGALKKAAKLVQVEAKRVIGTYEYGWAPLKPATVARKRNGDTPLLETGEMRKSIEYTVGHKEAEVGTNSQIAVYQELGTKTIPPRSFLGGAAQHKEKEIHALAGSAIISFLSSGKLTTI